MDSIASLLGLIQKAGRLHIGEEPVGAVCRSKKANLVLLASDAAENSVHRATLFAETAGVPILPSPFDKVNLGLAAGRPPCAMIAVTDPGFALSLARKIYALNETLDPEILLQIEHKSARALQRRKETLLHKKRLQRNKRPTQAPKKGADKTKRAAK